ncbi:hypothetical protein Nepgr_026926 [Nepenthes gracilis]|uniref:Uncharacterized protein n=1 Tax=Nepenthes gracilis TaxID=150966 RepID=A0AAD3T832_NEPGR|nr:hypothetical protein Nepgr_026926 [Nepenthes gracilis]
MDALSWCPCLLMPMDPKTMVSPEPRILGMNPECLGPTGVLGKCGARPCSYARPNGPQAAGWQDDCVGTKSSSRSLPTSTYLERTKSLWRHGALGASVGTDLSSAAPWNGKDRVGHLVYYNLFGSLRWQSQLMEQGITELEFQPDSNTYSEISQFGPRDPHNFEIPSDLTYDEKDESYYLTPIGALDPLGGGSEEKLVMAVATLKHFHHIEDPGDHDNDGQVKDYCHLDNKTIHSDLVMKCNLDVLTDYCNSDHNGEDSIDLKETFLNECHQDHGRTSR